ncbi:hypothetical protein MJT46_010934 [Ovis ammon polii x Ovis aries]|nr:hypothetical protein MJT46_010934 [Ovis ammon polii x Ovis aries]
MTETTKTHVILLACGSFNPITKGHIQMFAVSEFFPSDLPGGPVVKNPPADAGDTGTWTPEHLCSVSGSPTPSVPASDFRKSSEGAAQPSEIPPAPPPLGDFLSQGKQDDLAPVLEFQNQAGINLPELTCLLNTELNANAPFLWASPLHATPTPTK